MIKFNCNCEHEDGDKEQWEGKITQILDHENLVELYIQSRGSIYVMLGHSELLGNFASLPTHSVCCKLSYDLSDIFFNKEQLKRALENTVDAATVAHAISAYQKHAENEIFKLYRGVEIL